MLSGPGLVFVGKRDCKVEEAQVDEKLLGPGEVVVDLEVSIISAGTEVANFTGLDPRTRIPGSWNEYPHRPGYGAVGKIVAVGPPAQGPDRGLAVGDRVFAICRHARYTIAGQHAPAHREDLGKRRCPNNRARPYGIRFDHRYSARRRPLTSERALSSSGSGS